MTTRLPDRPAARDNEAARHRLTALLEDLRTTLHAASRQTAMTARLQRRLLGKWCCYGWHRTITWKMKRSLSCL